MATGGGGAKKDAAGGALVFSSPDACHHRFLSFSFRGGISGPEQTSARPYHFFFWDFALRLAANGWMGGWMDGWMRGWVDLSRSVLSLALFEL
ncbi:hypothetical protein BT67DRAFT_284652 [Trichocladium antarcticum]|uniref:Uncharacterized protein n=1 Tax=Trichocladium antarcticum TaxID=1450529 RepID=A0AAN6ZEL4_9PEZI|nr:hypothetical protein BT67DRAFT_284652 [Trichocladium antarcticum]